MKKLFMIAAAAALVATTANAQTTITTETTTGAAGGALMEGFGSDFGFDSTDDLLSLGDDSEGGFNRRVKEGPERRLARMVEISEERAAKILRKWVAEKAA